MVGNSGFGLYYKRLLYDKIPFYEHETRIRILLPPLAIACVDYCSQCDSKIDRPLILTCEHANTIGLPFRASLPASDSTPRARECNDLQIISVTVGPMSWALALQPRSRLTRRTYSREQRMSAGWTRLTRLHTFPTPERYVLIAGGKQSCPIYGTRPWNLVPYPALTSSTHPQA